MQINIKIKNLEEIKSAFRQAPRLMNTELRQALIKASLNIAGKSVMNAPHDTGFLQSSHWLRGGGNGYIISGKGLDMQAEVGPTADYAIFVHEGTKFMRGRPFLRKAVDSSSVEVEEYFTDAAQNVFDKIGRMV